MKQIESGLFEVEESMPCEPKDIQVQRYVIKSTFDRAEREEAATRILSFSQQLANSLKKKEQK